MGPALPSGLFIEHDRAIVSPFCGGALISPSEVVTAAGCLNPGVGGLKVVFEGGAVIRVDHARVRGEVAVLTLRSAAPVAPLSVAAEFGQGHCGFQVATFRYSDSSAGTMHSWAGCAVDSDPLAFTPGVFELELVQGEGSCHGDLGAPALNSAGELVGLLTTASVDDGEVCATRFGFLDAATIRSALD